MLWSLETLGGRGIQFKKPVGGGIIQFNSSYLSNFPRHEHFLFAKTIPLSGSRSGFFASRCWLGHLMRCLTDAGSGWSIGSDPSLGHQENLVLGTSYLQRGKVSKLEPPACSLALEKQVRLVSAKTERPNHPSCDGGGSSTPMTTMAQT